MDQKQAIHMLNEINPKIVAAIECLGLPLAGPGTLDWCDDPPYHGWRLLFELRLASNPSTEPPPANYGKLDVRLVDDAFVENFPTVHLGLDMPSGDWTSCVIPFSYNADVWQSALRDLANQCEQAWSDYVELVGPDWREFNAYLENWMEEEDERRKRESDPAIDE